MPNKRTPKGQSGDASAQRQSMTQEQIIEALRATADRPWTQELAFQQKVSGIMGGLPRNSTVTRDQVVEYLRRKEGMAA
ncbi:MAG: hypothetical protein OXI81_10610 [Paracoccaceae bacterium]|nr:hypothetical protein [Paracoccaceae bacterium]